MGRRFSNGIVGGPATGQFNLIENELSTVEENANLLIDPNGTGEVVVDSHLQIAGNASIKFFDNDGSNNYVALQSPAAVASDITFTLPGTAGTNGYFLQTDGSGTLTWADVAVEVTQDTTTSSPALYPLFTSVTTGQITDVNVANAAKLSFVPGTGTLTCTAISATNGTFSGNFSAGTITETSSIAYKTNISPISDALDKILQLDGVEYDRKDGTRDSEPGLIAEEVYKVLPNIVTLNDKGNPEGIMYTKIVSYLIEAVKTLKNEVESLKNKG